jgi:hypothetical protein
MDEIEREWETPDCDDAFRAAVLPEQALLSIRMLIAA